MENLNKVTDKLIGYLNSAEMFMKEQAPDFVNQFVAYHTWHASFEFKVWIAVIVIATFFLVLYIALDILEHRTEMTFFMISVSGIITIIGFVGVTCAYSDLKKLELAPKVYMVEAAKALVSKGSCK